MKTYSVWLEIEEHDHETDKYSNVAGACDFASLACFADLDQAIAYADGVQTENELRSQLHERNRITSL